MLKLRLALFGLRTDEPALARRGALELMLDDESWVRARIEPGSALSLSGDDEATIREGDVSYPARVAPVPEFAERRNARGVALGSIAEVCGLYAIVALDGGCGLSSVGRTCALCLGRELTERAGQWWPIEEVIEALRAAFDEGVAEFVHFNVGYLPGDDAGLGRLRPYIEAVRHYFDARVGVTMHPPAMLRAIDASYAMGIDVVCYNLEVAGARTLEKCFPGRARFLGRRRYMAALSHAAKVFPSGAVWSELVAGLNSPEETRNAVAELATMGVVPLLGFPQTGLPEACGARELGAVGAALFEETLAAGINMSWARDLSTALTPLEARHFVSSAPQLPVLLNQLGRNRFGALATRALARLRRRLRVRRVRASFDSSHL